MMESTVLPLHTPIGTIGDRVVTLSDILIAVVVIFSIVLCMLLVSVWRNSRDRAASDALAGERNRDSEARMAELLSSQVELQARMQAMVELVGSRQSELNRTISERLDGMTSRIGSTMNEQTRTTHENLSALRERLAVIDTAQNNIQSLANQVVELQSILSNKQSRGAFGQSRMEAIIADGLPSNAYEFQATLSNGNRPDCLIRMPNNAPSLVVDAKFPLESWHAVRETSGDDGKAAIRFRRDVEVHIRAIATKYLVPGETQDTAFLFVPSESVFAKIHEDFEALVQKAHRSRVVIVSPSLLMLSIQVIQAILKDSRMREQAHLIQAEVSHLLGDVGRLDDRIRKLQTHFMQAQKDVELALTSVRKVTVRGERIETLEFASTSGAKGSDVDDRGENSAQSKTGQLTLRIVDED